LEHGVDCSINIVLNDGYPLQAEPSGGATTKQDFGERAAVDLGGRVNDDGGADAGTAAFTSRRSTVGGKARARARF